MFQKHLEGVAGPSQNSFDALLGMAFEIVGNKEASVSIGALLGVRVLFGTSDLYGYLSDFELALKPNKCKQLQNNRNSHLMLRGVDNSVYYNLFMKPSSSTSQTEEDLKRALNKKPIQGSSAQGWELWRGGVGMVCLEHLKKAVELEASREIVAKRKSLVLVVPEGVKGNGWETLRKAISRVQDVFDQVVRASKEKDKESQVSKGMYREGRSYADVVAEEDIERSFGARKVIARMMGTKGMVSVTPISEYKGCFFVDSARRAMWFQDQGSLTVRGGVVALRRCCQRKTLLLVESLEGNGEGNEGGKGNSEARRLVEGKDVGGDASKCRATSIARVEDGAWSFTVAVSVIGEAEEDVLLRPESNRSKDEVTSAEGCVYQRPRTLKGYELLLGIMSTTNGASNAFVFKASAIRNLCKGGDAVAHSQESAKLKGNSVTARRKARSWPLSLKISLQKGAISLVSEKSRHFTGGQRETKGSRLATGLFLRFRWSQALSLSVVPFPKFAVVEPSRPPRELCVSGRAPSPIPEPPIPPVGGFQVEGLTPGKMVKVQSVLESLRIRIVRENGKGAEEENQNFKLEYERIRIQEEKEDCQKVFKYSKSRYCDASGTKRETWDQRFVSSVWKGKRLEWAALLACGALGGIVILWDSSKFECTEKVLGSFSVTVKFNSGEEGSFWLTSVYGPINPLWRKDFWLELQDLYGLTFPRWESGLLDPPLRNAAFTWSNMQADPICKRLDRFLFSSEWDTFFSQSFQEALPRWTLTIALFVWKLILWNGVRLPFRFENMWLLHPEFKEKFRVWCKSVRVKGGKDLKKKGVRGCVIKGRGESWRLKELTGSLFLERVEFGWIGLLLKRSLSRVLGCDKKDLMRVFLEFHTMGRHILDAVLIANEVVDEKRRSCASKEGVQPEMEIVDKGCLSSSSFAILVNGNAKGWVKASRGLRQGDPLSPFLFTLVADVLSRMLFRAEETGLTEGLPLGGNPKTIGFWDPVVERISRRLDGWKKAYLSLGGRITLIQSCLSHIPSYFLSLFKIPASIASKIEKMQRNFLWSGAGEGKKDHLVRWEVVSRPKELGGLGFGKISLRNIALLRKWLWRFPRERSGLWHKVIVRIYGTHPNGWDVNMVVRWSHRCPWKAIAQVFQEFSPFVRLVVGNGGENSLLGRSLVGSKVPSKVKALAWIVAHGKVNTNDKLQLRRPYKSLCPQWCILCKGNGESIDHLFLHCPVTIGLWNKLFKLAGLDWVPPRSFEDMLVIAFKGLGNSLRGKTLWQVVCLTLVWIVWQERNNRIFEDKGRSEETLWI
ncbi:putative ribonuclease H protein [Vitis vinifera]|uniref:Putative ribonuclease H protein n=1 Tax=Vitis vinifera TaxID=29760 RepID=A0A438D9N5_VITVI|nr:putative ribonuclease H protein [Vitis vinifera]